MFHTVWFNARLKPDAVHIHQPSQGKSRVPPKRQLLSQQKPILWLFLNSNAFPSLLLVFATKHHTLATEPSTNHQRHQGPKPLQSSCPNDCEDFESNNERSHFPHVMFICCCSLWNSPGDALIIIPTSKGSQWASLAPVTSLFRFLCLKILT